MAKDRLKVRATIEAEDRASAAIGKVESRFAKLGNSIKANAIKITAVLGTLVAAFRQLDATARLEGQTEALKRNLASQGVAFDGFISKLNDVSQGTVSTAKLIESSSKALLLGIPATEIAALLDVARVSSIATGDSVAKAFDDIATGIGRASPLILDNLGIVVKLGPAYEAYAASIGKSAEALTPLEQKTALLNEVLRVGEGRVKKFGDAQSELALRLQQASAASENFRDNAGRLGSVLALGLGAVVTRAGAGFVLLARGVALVTGNLARLASVLPGVGDKFGSIADQALQIDSRLGATARSMNELANQMSQGADIAGSALLGLSSDAKAAQNQVEALEKTVGGLGGTATETKSAVAELGEALGVVTSAELANEIEEITASLEKSREELGQNSREYVRLEEIARDKLDRLRLRIQSIKDGLGDLGDTTRKTSDSFGNLGRSIDESTRSFETGTRAIEGHTSALQRNASASASRGGSGNANLISTQFGSQGTYTFRNGRRVFVAPDGRIIP